MRVSAGLLNPAFDLFSAFFPGFLCHSKESLGKVMSYQARLRSQSPEFNLRAGYFLISTVLNAYFLPKARMPSIAMPSRLNPSGHGDCVGG